VLETVWIFTVPSVSRSPRWLHIGHVPRFRPKYLKKCRGIKCPGPNLNIIRLTDETPLFCPVILERKDQFLKGQLLPQKLYTILKDLAENSTFVGLCQENSGEL